MQSRMASYVSLLVRVFSLWYKSNIMIWREVLSRLVKGHRTGIAPSFHELYLSLTYM